MHLFNFFTCCFSSNTVIENPPKTPYDLLFDNENPRFKSFSNVETKSSNIEHFYYDREQYNEVLKDINNIQESLWKSRILTYTIRDKQVFMHYDPYKMGFTYYCSESLPYDLLNIIAMKYVRIFHCYDFFMDNKKTYFDDTHDTTSENVENEGQVVDTSSEDKIVEENNEPTCLYRLHYIDIDKKNKPITKGPFAKLKKNNINTTMDKTNYDNDKTNNDNDKNKNNGKQIQSITIPRCKNKFIHGGNLYNFEILKKDKTESGFRSPVIDNMKGFSYKDFKALQ